MQGLRVLIPIPKQVVLKKHWMKTKIYSPKKLLIVLRKKCKSQYPDEQKMENNNVQKIVQSNTITSVFRS